MPDFLQRDDLTLELAELDPTAPGLEQIVAGGVPITCARDGTHDDDRGVVVRAPGFAVLQFPNILENCAKSVRVRDLLRGMGGPDAENGHLRADLYHRLNVVGIEIPPLRDWLEDLPLLVAHFVAEINREQGKLADGPDPECLAALKSYSWPGNVRQLRNVIERAVVTRESGAITLQDLPDEIVNGRHDSGKFNAPVGLTLQSVRVH